MFNNLYMKAYELDSDGDDFVTRLSGPTTISVPMSCNSNTDSCSGSSGWNSTYTSVLSTGVTARMKVTVSIFP